MPDHRGLVSGREFQRTRHIALAIDSGKDENGRFHFQTNLLPSPLPLRERVVRNAACGMQNRMRGYPKTSCANPSPGSLRSAPSPTGERETLAQHFDPIILDHRV